MPSIKIVFPGESLSLDPESPGFAHGFGLFETIRLREGRIELWEAHWQRLVKSARVLGIDCPFVREEALGAVAALAEKLPIEAIIKLSLLKEKESSRLLVYSRPVPPLPDEIGLLLDAPFRIHEDSPLAGHKTHNYLENLLTLEAARQLGCFDGLRLNSRGHLAEGAISNLFFYRDDSWYTPCLESGALPGVVREQLVTALSVNEGSYALSDLLEANAVFLTNASIGLQPVDWLLSEGRKIPLQSRTLECYESAQGLLRERIEATAIRI